MHYIAYPLWALIAFILGITASPARLTAAPLNLPNIPLEVSTIVSPNILIQIDTSTSMYNIVPEAPYDPNTVYFTCPSSITLSPGHTVRLHVTGSGHPYMEYDGTDYDWGIVNTTGSGGYPQRCFDPMQSYKARLYANQGTSPQTPESYGPGLFSGNYLNWYFGSTPTNWGSGARSKPGTSRRIDIAKIASKGLVDVMQNTRVGVSSFNTNSSGAFIRLGIDDLDTSHQATGKSTIDALALQGSTPLAASLSDIGRYFVAGYDSTTLTLHPNDPSRQTTAQADSVFDHIPDYASGVTAQPPIQEFCQKNFVLLLTDGQPYQDQDISSYLEDYDGDCINATPACNDHDQKPGRPYTSKGSDYLDDVALALFEIDLRPDLDDYAGNEVINNVVTYPIGFADDQVINDPLMQDTATNGGGLFLTAKNSTELIGALQDALIHIQSQTSSLASVSLNGTSLHAESRLYQPQFNASNWSGNLLAIPIDATDGSLQSPLWEANTKLDAQSWDTDRSILTYDDAAGSGIAFRWSTLPSAMQATLNQDALGNTDGQGADRLDYLRGDRTHEGTGNTYRTRSHVLGDIVHSGPYYVGAPPFPDSLGSGYSSFRNAYQNRKPMVYVGANDGMLHGFDAVTGEEQLAYVPNAIFDQLSQLTSPSYTHRFYVDASPTVGDAHATFGTTRCDSGTSCWRSVLVSGLSRGGQGIFALDVTDPTQFSESNSSNLVLWEFTDADDSDLGYTYSQPSIVQMANGRWAAVFGNGYNNSETDSHTSSTGHAVLYIAFLDGGLDGNWTLGSDFIKLDTDTGDPATPNGLATPAVVDLDGDLKADMIYAGDLQGNLWKADVRNSDPAQWQFTGNQALFTASLNGTAQPITTRPEVGIHPQDEDGVLIYFGTGKHLEPTDHTTASSSTQTFYAVWDKPAGTDTVERYQLLAQTVDAVVDNTRVTSDHAIDWGTHKGWHLDLPTTSERSVTRPILRNDRLIFTTLIPDTRLCGLGGTGWLMELNAFTGSRVSFPPFDRDGDKDFDTDDLVTHNSEQVAPSGLQSPEGILATPAILWTGQDELKYSSGSSANVFVTRENPGPGTRGRQAWRTLP